MPTKQERNAVRYYLSAWDAMPAGFPREAILAAYDQIDRLEEEVARLRLIADKSASLCVCSRRRRDIGGDAMKRLRELGQLLVDAGMLESRYIYEPKAFVPAGEEPKQ